MPFPSVIGLTEQEIRDKFPDRARMYDVAIDNYRFVTQDDVISMLTRLWSEPLVKAEYYAELQSAKFRAKLGTDLGELKWWEKAEAHV